MAINLFIDTNIILDIFDNNRNEHKDSFKIFELIETEIIVGYLAESVLTTTDYILKKKFSKPQRQSLFKAINTLFIILPCTNIIFKKAIHTNMDDVEDSILYQIAVTNKLDYFVTNDVMFSKRLSSTILPVLTAKDFLKKI